MHLSKAHQCRLIAQQQAKGTPVTSLESNAYDMAKESATLTMSTTQESQSETSKSQMTSSMPMTSTKAYTKIVKKLVLHLSKDPEMVVHILEISLHK
uniref:Uncharacterized protein n=1 Tax=Romanomermis culicivorax TaxID=13658 RepID=A0A915JIR7_ROMCU